ncbi:hypothetical protein DL767_011217 [Monosporascus sp. MG133]|nr:hypothetical protein DL767_011217 [Monosporascus sp. MG133]
MGISDSTLRRHNKGPGMLRSVSDTDRPGRSSHPRDNYPVRLRKDTSNRPLAARHPLSSSRQHGSNDRLELPKSKDSNPASHRGGDKFKRSMSPSRESSNASLGLRSTESKRDPDLKPNPKRPFKSVSLGSAPGFTGTNLPFRFLKPRSGLGGNTRFGEVIAVSPEKSVSKYLENIGHSSVLRRSQGKQPGRRQDISTIKNWLIDCDRHATCQNVSPFLPTRVIDVRSFRLHVSEQDEQGLYVALSYCWGKTSTIKTTMENYEARQHRLLIGDETLPKTFKHSIWTARRLGFRYLWIDALCIIQGDQGDWQSESAKMATVFGNAALTFAATDSSHCQGGLFHGHGAGLHRDFFAWKSSAALRSGGRLSYAHTERIKDEIEAQIDRSPLNQRGWVFQEGLLSRRIVHFSKAQLIWECRSHMASGDGLLILDKRHLLRPFSELNGASAAERQAGPHKRWKLVAEGYSRRQFTNMKDRLAALAGVTRRYQDLFRDTPLLGLWRESIPAGLLWMVSSPGRRIQGNILPNVPSWSWLSIDAPVTLVCDDERRRKVRVINAPDIEWENIPMTSNVRKAELELKGAVVPKDQVTSRAQFWFDEDPRLPDNEIECLEILRTSKTVYPGVNFGSNSSTATQVTIATTYFLMLAHNGAALDNEVQERPGKALDTTRAPTSAVLVLP